MPDVVIRYQLTRIHRGSTIPVCAGSARLVWIALGTTIAVLSRGIPLVLVPLFASDQSDNATRVVAVGAAIGVPDPDPAILDHALERCPTDSSLRNAANRLANELAALPEPADTIQRLATTVTGYPPSQPDWLRTLTSPS
jgi:hypothetical protein